MSNIRVPSYPSWIHLVVLVWIALSSASGKAIGAPPAPYPIVIEPGTPQESAFLIKSAGASVADGTRHADPGQFWVYGFPLTAGARCRLELELDNSADSTPPTVTVLGSDNKPLPTRTERAEDGALAILWTVPDSWPMGRRQSVLISAKNSPVTLRSARLVYTDRDSRGEGMPDSMLNWMQAGLPPNVQPTLQPLPLQPYTVARASVVPSPALDVQTDALFLDRTDPASTSGWKARGYAVWSLLPSDADLDFAAKNPDAVQTGPDGEPIAYEQRVYPTPTSQRVGVEQGLIDSLLAAGSEGVCIVDPLYWAQAGYSSDFKQAWQARYNAAWQAPTSSIDARYRASRLMAQLSSDRVNTLLQHMSQQSPAARRMTALPNPLYSAEVGRISPTWQIVTQPFVEDVFAPLEAEALAAPVRYNGARRDLPFVQAYLGYSALRNVTRDLNRRLWFDLDTLRQESGNVTQVTAKDHFEQSLVAALLFADVSAYQIAAHPSTVSGGSFSDFDAEVANVNAALEEMHAQPHDSEIIPDDIGVLVGDGAQWQRKSPDASDLDGLYGLAVPLLQRGIPVQIVSLERSVDPGYLSHFRTLLLSYDFQKPLGTQTQAALANWVRGGGSLLFFGGSDAYNAVRDSWWRLAGLNAPQADLWTQLGLNLNGTPTTRSAPPEDLSAFKLLPVKQRAQGGQSVTFDLTPYLQQTGSVALRFSAASQNSSTASLQAAELRINGQVAASFLAGSEIENRFLTVDNRSQFGADRRFVSGSGSWTYQFDGLPQGVPVTFTADVEGDLAIQAAPAQPNFGHTLLTTNRISGLAELFPRLRIGTAYPATLYNLPLSSPPPSGPTNTRGPAVNTSSHSGEQNPDEIVPLYTLRSGGTPIWMQKVGRGLVINVGVAPGFFSTSARSGGLLRELTRLAYQRAGGVYREPGALLMRRGRYTIVRTFTSSRMVEGRTIDLLSPTLAVAEDRTIPPRSLALLADLGPDSAPPHIGFVSGRVEARLETSQLTAFFVRGAQGTRGIARLHRGGRQLAGARGVDRLGRLVAVTAVEDGDTVLVRYPNDPDGVAIRVGWR